MIVAAIALSLAAPLVVLRRRTLVAYYAADAAMWLFAILLRRHFPQVDFRLAAIVFAGLHVVSLSLFIACGRDVRWSAMRGALLAGIVYALAIPLMQVHPLDGDEPYYVAVTDSLVHDRDFDLRNQYAATGLKPQFNDPVGPHGEQYSRHEPFLSILLIPGFALFGVNGAIATIVLFGVLLVRSTIRLIEDEGVADEQVRAVFAFFAFAPPVLYYATRIWPEVPAAFFFVEAVRGVRAQRMQRWIPALFGLVMLKLRFLLAAVGLLAAIGWRIVRARRNRELPRIEPKYVVLALLIILAPLVLLYLLTGSATNVHVWGELLPAPGERYVTGFFGLLTDGMSGIPFQAPFYLFGLFALTRWKSAPPAFRLGTFAGAIYVLYLLPRPEWYGGWSPPLRYLVFLLPILALGAASMWDRISRGAIALFAAWTFGLAIHALAYPWRLFHIANGENAVGEWLSATQHADFSRLFPSFIRMNDASWIGVVIVLAIIVIGVRRTKIDLVIPLASLAIAFGFAHARQPGARVEFEDAHVIREGGKLYPEMYAMMRTQYRGGWVLDAGQSLSFLAKRGSHTIHAITGLGATIELADQAYVLAPADGYQRIRVSIPEDGRVTLRCTSGAINLDRMERE
ncbi:MAG: hypothetical protein M3Q69_09385 [Acidobacteriota bacterium]|nr:hypothetical protein [Acidobacteriota bacterium]